MPDLSFIKAWKKEQDHFQTWGTCCPLDRFFSVQKPSAWSGVETVAVRPATISPESARAEPGPGLTASGHQPAGDPPLESRPGRRSWLGLECL